MLCIGQGSNGKVHISKDPSVAIKTIRCCPCKKIFREIYFSKCLHHPNIIQSTRIEILKNEIKIYYPRKRMNLQKFLYRYKSQNKTHIPLELSNHFHDQIVSAYTYLHSNCIVHRDIKLDNILIGEYNDSFETLSTTLPNLYITDFGTMKFYAPEFALHTLTDRVCCLWLQPPEMLNFKKGEEYNPYKIDSWCIGCCLFAIYLGYYPFSGNCRKEIRNAIYTLDISVLNALEPHTSTLILSCLAKNPLERKLFSESKYENVKENIKSNIKTLLKKVLENLLQTNIDFLLNKTIEFLVLFKSYKTNNFFNYFELACLSLALDLCCTETFSVEHLKHYVSFYGKISEHEIIELKKQLIIVFKD